MSRRLFPHGRRPGMQPAGQEQRAMKLTQDDRGVLTLLRVAGAEGIALDGLLAQISGSGIRISRESAQGSLRKLLRLGCVELVGRDRWHVTQRGDSQ